MQDPHELDSTAPPICVNKLMMQLRSRVVQICSNSGEVV